jgi:hypothetical protein
MGHDAKQANDPRRRRARRPRRLGPTVIALIAGGLMVAACGAGTPGPGVAGAGSSSTTAKPSSKGSTRASALAYSRCMRAHGVPDFPDPNSKGQIQIQAGPGSDLGPDSPQMKSAMRACKALEPHPTAARQRQDFAEALKFAQCMRSHGVTGFPDPEPPGSGPQTRSQKGGGGNAPQFDPGSSQFKAAQKACRRFLPGGAELSTSTVGGAS